MKSVRERSILAVRIAKYGPLREPIRMLLFTVDQFSYLIKMYICCGSILSWVQFLIFLCFILIVTKTRKIKTEPRIKLNHNIYIYSRIYENVVHEKMGTGTYSGETCL